MLSHRHRELPIRHGTGGGRRPERALGTLVVCPAINWCLLGMLHNMRRPVPALLVSPGQREVLESVARSPSAPHRQVVRARALLMAADGLANTAIARAVSVSPASVSGWRARFAEEGLVSSRRSVRAGVGRRRSRREDRRDRGSDTELPSGGRNPLELPDHGRGYRGVEIDCAAGVVGAGPQTAPGPDVQAVRTIRSSRRSWSMSLGFI